MNVPEQLRRLRVRSFREATIGLTGHSRVEAFDDEQWELDSRID